MSQVPKTLSAAHKGEEIAPKIDRYVELRSFVNEHKNLGGEIKEWLIAKGMAEVKTPNGNIARLNPGKPGKPFFTWAIEKLELYLKPKAFKLACPRSADEVLLEQMLVEDPALGKCRMIDQHPAGKPTLEIIEAGK